MTLTWLGIAVLVFMVLACYIGYRRGFIKEVVSMFFLLLTVAIVWIINPYINQFVKENTPVYSLIQENCRELISTEVEEKQVIDSDGQKDLIENLSLPDFLKEDLKENNTAAIYKYLSVDSFTDYVAEYIACTVVNGITFLISFAFATVLIRIATYALDIIAKLPIINGANKAAGAILGLVKCLIFVWLAFLILTILCNTEIGKTGLALIEKDKFLNWIYENNIFVKVFMNIF